MFAYWESASTHRYRTVYWLNYGVISIHFWLPSFYRYNNKITNRKIDWVLGLSFASSSVLVGIKRGEFFITAELPRSPACDVGAAYFKADFRLLFEMVIAANTTLQFKSAFKAYSYRNSSSHFVNFIFYVFVPWFLTLRYGYRLRVWQYKLRVLFLQIITATNKCRWRD
jgi:hypothetical protein